MASAELAEAKGRLIHKIQVAKENNRKKEELGVIINRITKAVTEGDKLDKVFSRLISELQIAANNYRNQRTESLESEVNKTLAVAFPDRKFRVKIKWGENTKDTCKILINDPNWKDKNGNPVWARPQSVNGEFAKQLISASFIVAITIIYGSKIIFLDESTNSGDKQGLKDEGPFLTRISEMLQTFIIEHTPELYNHLPRREISLMKIGEEEGDKQSGKVIVESIIDYTGEEEVSEDGEEVLPQ